MGSVLSLLVMFRFLLVFQVLLSSLLAVADVLENLPGLLSSRNFGSARIHCIDKSKLRRDAKPVYAVYATVLNSLDFCAPQVRTRVYVPAIALSGLFFVPFSWPGAHREPG